MPKLRQSAGPHTTDLEGAVKPVGPVLDGVRGVDYFSQGLREHVLVEREVSDQPFQLAVFFFHLPESTQFTHAEMRILFFQA